MDHGVDMVMHVMHDMVRGPVMHVMVVSAMHDMMGRRRR